jgi:hypothetical protein
MIGIPGVLGVVRQLTWILGTPPQLRPVLEMMKRVPGRN